ncbi:MAG: hypothetical protein GF332_01700 [Candidatus Moranbacteria bacterium]|nr:hypothetical protein [Candidatus Moranbacteria bacterium]
MNKEKRIGIPRALLYYKYNVLWHTFFKELGFKIVTSPATNKKILQQGASLAVDESCLPVKIFLGHVDYLKNKADYIFIPRIASFKKNEELCCKFQGLYDITVNTFPDLNILHYNVDVNEFRRESLEFLRMGLTVCKNPIKIFRAYRKGKFKQKHLQKKKIRRQARLLKNKKLKKILIVAHPYILFDGFTGKTILDYLKSQNIAIIDADIAQKKLVKKLSQKISQDLYWTYNKELVGAIDLYKNKVDGIIYVSAFPCGPDSLVVEICQKKIKNIPSINIIIDELQGEAGLITRLESFIDILEYQQKSAKNYKS